MPCVNSSFALSSSGFWRSRSVDEGGNFYLYNLIICACMQAISTLGVQCTVVNYTGSELVHCGGSLTPQGGPTALIQLTTLAVIEHRSVTSSKSSNSSVHCEVEVQHQATAYEWRHYFVEKKNYLYRRFLSSVIVLFHRMLKELFWELLKDNLDATSYKDYRCHCYMHQMFLFCENCG